MVKTSVKTIDKLYEGDDLKGCLWNIFIEDELNLSEQDFCNLMDKPSSDFDHMNYLGILVEDRGHQIVINQLEDCVQIVLK